MNNANDSVTHATLLGAIRMFLCLTCLLLSAPAGLPQAAETPATTAIRVNDFLNSIGTLSAIPSAWARRWGSYA
ncbi:MAG: hypothetical protein NTX50_19005 [Candidatus Sumerlaeota bacterium]|nr:hypothetical protein [Candidatus Sumerlaeota bacterium]